MTVRPFTKTPRSLEMVWKKIALSIFKYVDDINLAVWLSILQLDSAQTKKSRTSGLPRKWISLEGWKNLSSTIAKALTVWSDSPMKALWCLDVPGSCSYFDVAGSSSWYSWCLMWRATHMSHACKARWKLMAPYREFMRSKLGKVAAFEVKHIWGWLMRIGEEKQPGWKFVRHFSTLLWIQLSRIGNYMKPPSVKKCHRQKITKLCGWERRHRFQAHLQRPQVFLHLSPILVLLLRQLLGICCT